MCIPECNGHRGLVCTIKYNGAGKGGVPQNSVGQAGTVCIPESNRVGGTHASGKHHCFLGVFI